MEDWFKDGYDHARRNIAAQKGAEVGNQYVQKINDAILSLTRMLTLFQGTAQVTDSFKVTFAEFGTEIRLI